MADRCLLHKSKLDSFAEWLLTEGWEIHDPKGYYEVLRAKKNKKWLIVYRKLDKDVHYSVRDEDAPIVRRFIREAKNPWKRINDGFSNLCNEKTYQRTCPFCKRQHEQREFINIICQCGGKYYFAQEFWLDRKTGERKQDGK